LKQRAAGEEPSQAWSAPCTSGAIQGLSAEKELLLSNTSGHGLQVLGDSPFNYEDFGDEVFRHYYKVIQYVRSVNPKTVLEIGPGDHTVTDYLRRKGIVVETFDNEPKLHPDYLGDVREPLAVGKSFDAVVACEVFEHLYFKYLPRILENIGAVLNPDGHLVVSLPYSTVRLFPKRTKYGRILSCEGRLLTHIPYWLLIQPFLPYVRAVYRFFKGKKPYYSPEYFPDHPEDQFEYHRWDVGLRPTTIGTVEKVFEERFSIVSREKAVPLGIVYWVLRKKRPG
jgi:SAM-dependent methyltransferase